MDLLDRGFEWSAAFTIGLSLIPHLTLGVHICLMHEQMNKQGDEGKKGNE